VLSLLRGRLQFGKSRGAIFSAFSFLESSPDRTEPPFRGLFLVETRFDHRPTVGKQPLAIVPYSLIDSPSVNPRGSFALLIDAALKHRIAVRKEVRTVSGGVSVLSPMYR